MLLRHCCRFCNNVAGFGNNVERNFVLSTKSKQIEHVQFVSTLSKGQYFTTNVFDIVAECCFDKVERCFDIVAVVDGALCAACISDVRIKTSLSASWVCPCRLPDLSRSLTASSTPSGQPQRKPAGQMCHACSVVLPAVVDWQIVDVAVIRRWSLVDRHPSGTGELVRADSLHHDVELVRDSYTRRQTCIF